MFLSPMVTYFYSWIFLLLWFNRKTSFWSIYYSYSIYPVLAISLLAPCNTCLPVLAESVLPVHQPAEGGVYGGGEVLLYTARRLVYRGTQWHNGQTWIVCCVHLKFEFGSCGSGCQWCGILSFYFTIDEQLQ